MRCYWNGRNIPSPNGHIYRIGHRGNPGFYRDIQWVYSLVLAKAAPFELFGGILQGGAKNQL